MYWRIHFRYIELVNWEEVVSPHSLRSLRKYKIAQLSKAYINPFQSIAHLLEQQICMPIFQTIPRILNDYNSKIKNHKTNFSLFSAHCASFRQIWPFMMGQGEGVSMSLTRNISKWHAIEILHSIFRSTKICLQHEKFLLKKQTSSTI